MIAHKLVQNYPKGFTLVELLVVIGIIGVLTAVGIVALGTVSKNGRDAKRLTDLRTIQGALEQYYADQGVYPMDLTGELTKGCSLKADNGVKADGCSTDPNTNTVKTYYNKLPKDPNGGPYVYRAFETNTGTVCSSASKCISYCLYTVMEGTTNTASDNQTNEIASEPCRSGAGSYNFAVSKL